MFLRRESSTSSTTRISKMNPSAARRAKRSGRDRQVPARSGQRQQLSVRSAGGKPPFPSNLPRAVRFIAVSASSAGRRKRPRQPGKSLFQTLLLGGQGMSAQAAAVLLFSKYPRWRIVCTGVPCLLVPAGVSPPFLVTAPHNGETTVPHVVISWRRCRYADLAVVTLSPAPFPSAFLPSPL